MINFCFESINGGKNFVKSNDINTSGFDRFTSSPFFNRMNIICSRNLKYWNWIKSFSIEDKPERYIIPVGVNNDPSNWAGGNLWNRQDIPSFFNYINEIYLNDLRNKNAFLLIDSSLEGYHDDLVFNFLHNECDHFMIPPTQIIFVTGNSIIEERYRLWLYFNPKEENINVIPYSHFENDVFLQAQDMGNKIPKFDDQVKYKSNNEDKIKLYSFLNKKTREHRIWFYTLLHQQNMLDEGLVSMNNFVSHERTLSSTTMSKKLSDIVSMTTPKTIYNTPNQLFDNGFYVKRIHYQTTLDSWVSLISEARFEDSEGTVFLSEKIFKPIACHHPFIILGNRNSLVELKKLGYMTFEDYFDESYDNETDIKRMESIIKTIKDIQKIKNKLDWFKGMEKILKHNYDVIRYNTTEVSPPGFDKIKKIFYIN